MSDLLEHRRRELERSPPLVLRRARIGERPFAYEWRLLELAAATKPTDRANRLLTRAVEILYGFSRALREHVDMLAYQQKQKLELALAAVPTRRTRINVGKLQVVLLSELREHSPRGGYRVQGPPVFFGHEFTHDESGKRVYLRAWNDLGEHQQKGIAEKLGVCVRTVRRWYAYLSEVWNSCRPPRNAKDAWITRCGSQVYTQRWLSGGTPNAIRDRLPLDHLRRAPRRPDASAGVPLRVDASRELQAYLDGSDIPY